MKILKIVSLVHLLIFGAVAADVPPTSTNTPACCVKAPVESSTATDRSLYQLESVWTDDAAREMKLGSLAGRPQVITLFFATCIYACPILVHDMKRIEAALPGNLRTNAGFTLVSFDSKNDSPEVLSAFRKQHGLAGNWTLLRAESDDVLELAALLGVKFKKEPSGQFAHSNIITVLNAQGEIVFQQAGLNSDPAGIAEALRKSMRAAAN